MDRRFGQRCSMGPWSNINMTKVRTLKHIFSWNGWAENSTVIQFACEATCSHPAYATKRQYLHISSVAAVELSHRGGTKTSSPSTYPFSSTGNIRWKGCHFDRFRGDSCSENCLNQSVVRFSSTDYCEQATTSFLPQKCTAQFLYSSFCLLVLYFLIVTFQINSEKRDVTVCNMQPDG